MADLGGFDASQVEPSSGGYEPLPEAEYRVMITASEVKRNKADNGSYLSLTLDLTGNDNFDGRKLFVNLNLDHPNAQAVEIANKELSAICHAVGVLKPGDSTKLHDIPFMVKVGVEKRKDTGALTNRIKKFMSLDAAGEQPKTQGSSAGKADWMGK